MIPIGVRYPYYCEPTRPESLLLSSLGRADTFEDAS